MLSKREHATGSQNLFNDMRRMTQVFRGFIGDHPIWRNCPGGLGHQIMEGIARLLHVAEIHERRITRLAGGE